MANDDVRWDVAVAGGTVPVLADPGHADETPATLIIAHGAGSHMEQKTILWLASLARTAGLNIVRFNFLYRALGRGMPDRMPTMISTYRSVIDSVREQVKPSKLYIGGHSMGGRVASMLEAEGQTTDGLILFGYPLHPDDEPEKLRDAHLPQVKTRTLQLSGTDDPLCTKALMEVSVARLDPNVWTLHWIEGADHSYGVRKSTGRSRVDVEEEVVKAIQDWLKG